MEKIINALKLKIPPRDLTSEDNKVVAQAIMSKWLPCADAVLEAVAEQLPSPAEAQINRIPKLWQQTVGATTEITAKQKVRKIPGNFL
jgi:ribosome assembly protein 1